MARIINKFSNQEIVKLFSSNRFSVFTCFIIIFIVGFASGGLILNFTGLSRAEDPSTRAIKGILSKNLYFNIFEFIKQGFENDKAGIKWTVLAEDETSAVELVSIQDHMPLHRHKGENHYTYVVSGIGEYTQLGKVISLEPGKFILTPMMTPHAVQNKGQEPLMLLVFSSPKPFREEDIEWIK